MKSSSNLAEQYPQIAAMLHPSRNGDRTAETLAPASKKKVWWVGECGHVWEKSVIHQVRSGKCPFCIGRRILEGFNDLATTHPAIAAEWSKSRNKDLQPNQVSKGFTKKVWWECSNGHEWQSTVNNRTNLGRGCPICTGQIRVEGVNDLTHSHPKLAREWHPTRNGALKPSQVGKGTIRPVWWQCELGHAWRASPNNRVNGGTGCPYCSGTKVLPGFNDLATTHPDLCKEWHPNKNSGMEPNRLHPGSKEKAWWIGPQCGHVWQARVRARVSGSGCPVCVGQLVVRDENDLSTTHPHLVKQWHPDNNCEITPESVTAGSDKKVWWVGPCGHEWRASIGHRVRGRGCPVCGNDTIVAGVNDLATTHPDLAREWHPEKNGQLTPADVVAGASEKFWWHGKCGHEWEANLSNRSRLGAGCPICAGIQVLPGFNDLATRYPRIASEWHSSRNGDLLPEQVSPGSRRIVWWLGTECGHEWEQRIQHRIRGHGCTVCWEPWSRGEKQVVQFVSREFPDLTLIENFRGSFLGVLELDIYIPELRIGIEFNGEYWHDETRDPSIRERHRRKQNRCDEAGVRLAVVWESAWKTEPAKVEAALRRTIAGARPPDWMRLTAGP